MHHIKSSFQLKCHQKHTESFAILPLICFYCCYYF